MPIRTFPGIIFTIFFLGCFSPFFLSEDSELKFYQESMIRSAADDMDLFLVPQKYSILDDHSLESERKIHLSIKKTKEALQRNGISWESFLEKNQGRIELTEDTITLSGKGTTHFTGYSYDTQIPILFYGKKFIKPGIYTTTVFQQHIVPSLAALLDSPIPNDSLKESLPIFSETPDLPQSEKNPPLFTEKGLGIPRVTISERKEIPELIVTIVVDQGGFSLYKTHPNSFPNIRMLMKESAFFPNARVGHLDAHTGPGHASIGTGAFPKQHRVHANELYTLSTGMQRLDSVLESKSLISSDESRTEKLPLLKKIPLYYKKNQVHPGDLKSPSFADVWDLYRRNKPIIISQCYAPRASIGMAGHGSFFGEIFPIGENSISADKDFVYWVDKNSLAWTTNFAFYSLPGGVEDFNLKGYHLRNNYAFRDPGSLLFQKQGQDLSGQFYELVSTVTQSRLEGELIRSVIKREIIEKNFHQDGETDLVFVTFKATDASGHLHGFESEEAREVLEETDRQIGLLKAFLDKNYGDSYVIVLTADHGAAPLREVSEGMFLSIQDLAKNIQNLLPPSVRNQYSLIKYFTSGAISLNRNTMAQFGISEREIIRSLQRIQINGKPFFQKVLTRKDLGLDNYSRP
jgi:hypothetical protein